MFVFADNSSISTIYFFQLFSFDNEKFWKSFMKWKKKKNNFILIDKKRRENDVYWKMIIENLKCSISLTLLDCTYQFKV